MDSWGDETQIVDSASNPLFSSFPIKTYPDCRIYYNSSGGLSGNNPDSSICTQATCIPVGRWDYYEAIFYMDSTHYKYYKNGYSSIVFKLSRSPVSCGGTDYDVDVPYVFIDNVSLSVLDNNISVYPDTIKACNSADLLNDNLFLSRFSVTTLSSSGKLGYSWQCSADSGATWTTMSWAGDTFTNNYLKTHAIFDYLYHVLGYFNTNNPGLFYFRCLITGIPCNNLQTSEIATLLISAKPTVTVTPPNISGCSPTTAVFTAHVSSCGPFTYHWYNSSDNPDTGTATNSTYSLSYTGTYTCTCEVTNFCGSSPGSATVTIYPTPVISVTPDSRSVCEGDSANFVVNVSSGTPPFNYVWAKINNSTVQHVSKNNIISIFPVTLADSGTYLYGVSDTTICNSTVKTFKITVNPKPVISKQPVSDSVCFPDTAKCYVKATGDSLSYQWYKQIIITYSNTHPITIKFINFPITGATDTAYSIAHPDTSNGNYFCIVTNKYGCKATSDIAALSVRTPPSPDNIYVIQPKQVGDSVTYSLSVGGTPPFKFQWIKNDTIITGATTGVYKIRSIACGDTGIYSCKIKNSCDSVVTKVVNLYVLGCSRYEHAISGYVRYDNSDTTKMTNTTVYLLNDSNKIIDSIVTDCNGFYIFNYLINGTYKLTCSTKKAWGGVNPIDALLVDRTYIHLNKFTDPLLRLAADLNDDEKINPIDALLIDRRYIHLIHKFPNNTPDWLFSNPTVHLDNVDITQKILAICAGDVNASYTPPGCPVSSPNPAISNNKSHNFTPQTLTTISLDSLVAEPGTHVTFHLNLNDTLCIGAIGLQIQYNHNVLTYESYVQNPNITADSGNIYLNHIDDTLFIAYIPYITDTSCLNLNNAPLLDLKFLYKGGSTALSFVDSNSFICDNNLNNENVIYSNGSIGPLYIITQPQNATKCLGDSVSFSIAAAGTDSINYRWLKLVAGSWTLEPGDTNSVFKISQVALSDSGKYKFVASNKYGRLSDSVTLTVNTPVAITYSSPDTTTCSVPVTLNCFATGTGLSYQWYNSESAVGYGNDTLITSVADNYYCIVSGACAGTTSSYTTLTVNTPPSILTQPQNDTVCSGANASFSLLASGTSLTYQWYDMNWNIVGEDSTLAINNVELNNSNNNYQCYVSNYCLNVWSDAAYIFVDTLPSISQQPEFNSVCAGSEQDFYIYASSNGFYTLYYQWYRNDTLYPDSINPTFNVLNSKLSDEGVYFCTVSNTCGSVSSDTASLFTDSQIQIINQPSGATIESGESFSFSIAVKGNGLLSFQWYQDGSMTGYNDSVYYISSASSGDAGKYVCEITDACWDVFSDTVELDVVDYNPCDPHFRRYLHPNGPPPVCGRLIHNNQTLIDPEVNLYPNPNDGSFTLELKLPSDGNVTLEAYNILGELVQRSESQVQSPSSTIHYSLSTTNKGIYFLNIITSTKTFNRKVIIE